MKIRETLTGKDKLSDSVRRRQNEQALEQAKSERAKTGKVRTGEVDVSLSQHIQNELSVDQILAERREKVDALKEKIKANNYNPSLDKVAGSVEEELFMSIADARLAGITNEVE